MTRLAPAGEERLLQLDRILVFRIEAAEDRAARKRRRAIQACW